MNEIITYGNAIALVRIYSNLRHTQASNIGEIIGCIIMVSVRLKCRKHDIIHCMFTFTTNEVGYMYNETGCSHIRGTYFLVGSDKTWVPIFCNNNPHERRVLKKKEKKSKIMMNDYR